MTAACAICYSLQNRYAGAALAYKLLTVGISSNAVMISGRAVIGGKFTEREEFFEATFDDICEALTKFLRQQELHFQAESLVILDIEPGELAPRHIGDYGGDTQEKLIGCYRLRIDVARQVLADKGVPGLKLGLYQVIVPDPKGLPSTEFEQSMEGYLAAGRQGMYDRLDFICPVLYQRFVPADGDPLELREWYTAATRQAIAGSLDLSRSDGTSIPLVPVLSLWVLSNRPRIAVSPASVADQLAIVQAATRIEAILFWSGWETHEEMQEAAVQVIDIDVSLANTGALPWPGCPPVIARPEWLIPMLQLMTH